jgi:hypothetical protein
MRPCRVVAMNDRKRRTSGLKSVHENRKRNSRSHHFATPDFLWNLVALADLMRLSLKRKAHTRLCPVLRGRKSGYAPVGMTILSTIVIHSSGRFWPLSLQKMCHPDRSVAKWRDLLFLFRFSHPSLALRASLMLA